MYILDPNMKVESKIGMKGTIILTLSEKYDNNRTQLLNLLKRL